MPRHAGRLQGPGDGEISRATVGRVVPRHEDVGGDDLARDRGNDDPRVTGADDQIRADGPEGRAEGPDRLQQEPGSIRGREASVQQRRVDDVQGNDPIRQLQGTGQGRVVVKPEIAAEPDDGSATAHRQSFRATATSGRVRRIISA